MRAPAIAFGIEQIRPTLARQQDRRDEKREARQRLQTLPAPRMHRQPVVIARAGPESIGADQPGERCQHRAIEAGMKGERRAKHRARLIDAKHRRGGRAIEHQEGRRYRRCEPDFQQVAACIIGQRPSQVIEQGIVGRRPDKAKCQHATIVQQQPEPRLLVVFTALQRRARYPETRPPAAACHQHSLIRRGIDPSLRHAATR
jgi:hypothetical protein